MYFHRHSPGSPSSSPDGSGAWMLLEPACHHEVMLEIAEAFQDHDGAALARLSPAERADQTRARQTFQDYVIAVWAAPKLRAFQAGLDHDPNDPLLEPGASSCVAGLVALAGTLVEQAERAQAEANDPALINGRLHVVAPCDRYGPHG